MDKVVLKYFLIFSINLMFTICKPVDRDETKLGNVIPGVKMIATSKPFGEDAGNELNVRRNVTVLTVSKPTVGDRVKVENVGPDVKILTASKPPKDGEKVENSESNMEMVTPSKPLDRNDIEIFNIKSNGVMPQSPDETEDNFLILEPLVKSIKRSDSGYGCRRKVCTESCPPTEEGKCIKTCECDTETSTTSKDDAMPRSIQFINPWLPKKCSPPRTELVCKHFCFPVCIRLCHEQIVTDCVSITNG